MSQQRISTARSGPPKGRVTGAAIISVPGDNGVWDTGEVVTAQLVFNAPVTVTAAPGSGSTLAVLLDGVRREAAYTGGSGTAVLTFAHTWARRMQARAGRGWRRTGLRSTA